MSDVREVLPGAARTVADFFAVADALKGPYRPARESDARALIAGTHPLSGQVTVRAFVAYRADVPVGRVLVTQYAHLTDLYAGFFECIDDADVARTLFAAAEQAAADLGSTAVVGPVDASFWIQDRLKSTGFENAPYFSEPLNPPYYQRLFEAAGYSVSDTYVSHLFPPVPPGKAAPVFDKHVQRLEARGVRIGSPHWWQWDRTLREIHALLHELYKDFPVFVPIGFSSFRELYKGLRLVTDMSMVSIAHHEGRAVGFFVALPDYPAAATSGPAWRALLTIARHRRRPARYVLAYLGASPEYKGLGAALTGVVTGEVRRRNAGAVGTLIHEDGPTTRWATDLVAARNTYVLLRKEL